MGQLGGIKLYIAEKIVEDSVYQHVGITEPHYSLPPNIRDYSNTNPFHSNKITLIWETRVEAKKNLWQKYKITIICIVYFGRNNSFTTMPEVI